MHRLAAGLIFLSLFVPNVSAEFFGTQKELASIVFTGLWIPFILGQFICAVIYLFIARPGHRSFGPVFVVGLLFMLLASILSLVAQIILTTVEPGFGVDFDIQTIANLELGERLLGYWADALIFLGIAQVIQDRYVTFGAQRPNDKSALSQLRTRPIISTFAFFASLLIILSSAQVGIARTTQTSPTSVDSQLEVSFGLIRALTAFYFIGTFLLIPFAVIVKIYVKTDRIINLTLFGVVPLCSLRAIAVAALSGVSFSLGPFVDEESADVLSEASAALNGVVFYGPALSILAYFFIAPRLWEGALAQSNGNAQAQLPQNVPPGQFAGQMAYTGQPVQMAYAPGMYGQPQAQTYVLVPQHMVFSPPQTGPIQMQPGPQIQTPPQATNSAPQLPSA